MSVTLTEHECSICLKKFKELDVFLKHAYLHSKQARFSIKCCFDECFKKYNWFEGLKSHLIKSHRYNKQKNTNNLNLCSYKYKCLICSELYDEQKALIIHYLRHLKERNLSCLFGVCLFSTSNAKSFRTHILRNHTKNDNIISGKL